MIFVITENSPGVYQVHLATTDKAEAKARAQDLAASNPGINVIIAKEVTRAQATVTPPIITIP